MEKKKEEKKRRISSFNGYLSHSSSRVEFELKLGLRLTNKINNFQTGTFKIGEAERGWGQKHFELAP